jgi:hypothetical protein
MIVKLVKGRYEIARAHGALWLAIHVRWRQQDKGTNVDYVSKRTSSLACVVGHAFLLVIVRLSESYTYLTPCKRTTR